MRKITALLALSYCLSALPAQAADKLTVLLDWFVNPDHATLIIAQEKGFFAQRNLEVEMIAPANPNDPPKLVAAKKADLAISYQPQLHRHVDQLVTHDLVVDEALAEGLALPCIIDRLVVADL